LPRYPLFALGLDTAGECRAVSGTPCQEACEFSSQLENVAHCRKWRLAGPQQRELGAGAVHHYQVFLTTGQFLRVRLTFHGIEGQLRLYRPDGNLIEELPIPSRTYGRIRLMTIGSESGVYQVQVQCFKTLLSGIGQRQAHVSAAGRYFGSPLGTYGISLEHLRSALAEDEPRIRGERAFVQGWHASQQDTVETSHRGPRETFRSRIGLA
jgi:hypothetical protein